MVSNNKFRYLIFDSKTFKSFRLFNSVESLLYMVFTAANDLNKRSLFKL